MKKQILLFSCFIIVISSLYAQPVNTTIGDVVMPAPTAASLGEYSDVPVNYYSGLPSISIPIYTVQEGNLSLPISLSYHAGGIRAAEMASWVGLGWSLNAGGVITRTTLGLRDEQGMGYYNMGSSLILDDVTAEAVAKGQRDGEPDIFSFNVGGYAGKFILDANKNPFLIPKQDIDIIVDYGANQFNRFTLIPPDGTKYIFGLEGTQNATEKSRMSDIQTAELNFHASSWYLVKIVSADGNYSINLEYEDEDYSFRNAGSCSRIITNCMDEGTQTTSMGSTVQTCTGIVDANLPNPYNYISSTKNNVEGKRLKKISCSTSVIEFIATNNREDVEQVGSKPARRLDRITIKPGDESTNFCTEWELDYEYFTDGLGLTGSLSKRLKLNSVQQKSCNSSDASNPNPYLFTYNGTTNSDGTQFLPIRITKAVDHWGYYNGATDNNAPFSNQINIPTTTIETSDGGTYQHGQSNRETNEAFMKYGSLEQIQYPTGGTTTFVFEAHKHSKITSPEVINRYLNFPITNCGTILDPLCCDMTNIPSASVTFESLEQIQNTFFTVSLLEVAPDNMSNDCYPIGSPDAEINIKVSKVVNGQNQFFTNYGYNLGQCQANMGSPCDGQEKMLNTMSSTTNFEPNVEYVFELEVKNGKGSFDLYEKVVEAEEVLRDVGGLRVAQISIKPDENSTDQEIKRTYKYVNVDNKSSGVLLDEPIYGYAQDENYNVVAGGGNVTGEAHSANFQEQSVVPLSSFEGRHIGYRRVEEIHQNGNETNGKRVFNFYMETINDAPDEHLVYPVPPVLARIFDGNIESENTFDKDNNELSTTSNTVFNDLYSVATGTIYKASIFNIACQISYNPMDPSAMVDISPTYVTVYQPRTRPYRIKSSVQVIDGVATTTTYDYDGMGNHLFPTEISMTNSNGSVYKTVNKYVFDVDDPNDDDDVTSDLIDRNIISMPHIIEQYVDDNHVSGNKTDYAFFYADGRTSDDECPPDDTGCMDDDITDPFPYPEKFYDYKANADGSQGRYELEGTIISYWGDGFAGKSGYPRGFQMDGWAFSETYDWENGLIKERKYGDFVWKYDYHPNTRLVSKITDIDDQPVFYNYDELMRLEKVLARPKTTFSDPDPTVDAQFNTVTTYTYNFKQEVENGMSEPDNNYNYVRTRTDFTPVGGSELEFQESTQYMDGLGRPIQSVQRAYSAEGMNDVVVAQVYDNQGRVSKAYEPFEGTNNNGYYIDVPTNHPHAMTEYEDSPLNRVSQVTPPAWNYPTLRSYGKNTSTDAVKDLATSSTATFDEGLLSKSVVEDPNGNKTITFTDKRGRLILSRRTNQNEDTDKRADTYYLYDDKDRLITVVPPGAETTYTDLIYEYTYDEENRVTAKKIPGAASMTMSYDDRDLVVAMQDGLLASQTTHKYLLTKYDDYGRVDETGFASALPGDLNSFTITSANLLSKNYYDGASDDTDEAIDLDTHPIYRGKIRKTRTRLLDEFGPADHSTSSDLVNWIDNLLVYDAFGRAIENRGNNHLKVGTAGGEETLLSKYDFADNILVSNRTHQAHKSIQVYDQYRYDHKGRQKSIFNTITHQNITSPQEQICQLTYDHEDQITVRSLGGVANGFLQNCDYTYNEQGWLTAINDFTQANSDLFAMELTYAEDINYNNNLVASAQKNGNITNIEWETGIERYNYAFTYDYLDRLTKADYANTANYDDNAYDTEYVYDKRGNITHLKRHGFRRSKNPSTQLIGFQKIVVDDLNYYYKENSNELESVNDVIFKNKTSLNPCENEETINNPIVGDGTYQASSKLTVANQISADRDLLFRAGSEVILEDGFLSYDPNDNDPEYDPGGLLIRNEECLHEDIGFIDRHDEKDSNDDFIPDYAYDQNGNLIEDKNKEISSISYNHLNLPYKVEFDNGGSIEWIYDASGRKLRKIVKEGAVERYTQDYFGGIEYRGQELEAIYHAEGRATLQLNNTFKYEYVLRDHLGNSRVIFADNNNDDVITEDEVLQESHYYPFGMTIDLLSETYSGEQNDYQYNGKELNNDFGLSWMDYGARFYDPQIGRWNGVDAMADQRRWVSPYNYAQNNPILRIDPTGMLDDPYYNRNGEIIYDDGKVDGNAYFVTDNKEARRLENGKIALDDVTSAIKLPNAEVRAAIGDAVDASNSPSSLDSEGGKHEEGLVWGQVDGEQKIVKSKSGGAPSEEAGVSTQVPLEIFTAQDQSEQLNILQMRFGGKGNSLGGTAHIHPSGTHNGLDFKQPPSPQDRTTQRANPTTSGYSIVVGAGSKRVYFYNAERTLGSLPLETFRKM